MPLWVYALIFVGALMSITGYVDWRRRHSTRGGDDDRSRYRHSDHHTGGTSGGGGCGGGCGSG